MKKQSSIKLNSNITKKVSGDIKDSAVKTRNTTNDGSLVNKVNTEESPEFKTLKTREHQLETAQSIADKQRTDSAKIYGQANTKVSGKSKGKEKTV